MFKAETDVLTQITTLFLLHFKDSLRHVTCDVSSPDLSCLASSFVSSHRNRKIHKKNIFASLQKTNNHLKYVFLQQAARTADEEKCIQSN